MSVILKCNVCNIIIDEMLSYIQNKISVSDEETLVRICTSSFTSEEIKRSKTLLFDSIPTSQRKIDRKNKGKEERNLEDIINVLKTVDPDTVPLFVAHQLEKLPPMLFEHLDCSKILKELMRLRAEIEDVKNTYVTNSQLEELRSDMHHLNYASLPPSNVNVNMKRGAWTLDRSNCMGNICLDSGPMGLSQCSDSTLNDRDEVLQQPSNDLQRRGVYLAPYEQNLAMTRSDKAGRQSVSAMTHSIKPVFGQLSVDAVCSKQQLACDALQDAEPQVPGCYVPTPLEDAQCSDEKLGCESLLDPALEYCVPDVPQITDNKVACDATESLALQYRALGALRSSDNKVSCNATQTPTVGYRAPHAPSVSGNKAGSDATQSSTLGCRTPQGPPSSSNNVTNKANLRPTLARGYRAPHGSTSCAAPSKEDGEWKLVSKRKPKPKYRYLGQMGKAQVSESTFKAATLKTPVFISNVHKDTLESDVIDYIYVKTQERVSLDKIYIKKQVDHKAYKFFVTETKLPLFLDEKIWPQGIIFRRFVHFKPRQADGVSATDGPLDTKFVSFNCKNVKRSIDGIRSLCDSCDIIALQETWLLPEDISFLSCVDSKFSYTGTSAVDTTAGVVRGRYYGGVALLWNNSVFH
ncbi:Mutant cadherin, partial [Operophtera brumata]